MTSLGKPQLPTKPDHDCFEIRKVGHLGSLTNERGCPVGSSDVLFVPPMNSKSLLNIFVKQPVWLKWSSA